MRSFVARCSTRQRPSARLQARVCCSACVCCLCVSYGCDAAATAGDDGALSICVAEIGRSQPCAECNCCYYLCRSPQRDSYTHTYTHTQLTVVARRRHHRTSCRIRTARTHARHIRRKAHICARLCKRVYLRACGDAALYLHCVRTHARPSEPSAQQCSVVVHQQPACMCGLKHVPSVRYLHIICDDSAWLHACVRVCAFNLMTMTVGNILTVTININVMNARSDASLRIRSAHMCVLCASVSVHCVECGTALLLLILLLYVRQ